ncbi:predicted protein [Scheffersomyces stipitis CBS 6054]|uniref:Uncharacterized protein n=1 Tax=Scheffersomyces stipitis (strain ATCC 58785 / CBS 6054 / NBRC 10063 / NRRL Y-11545) TaxID=322104 RepID=A3LRV9_PICST|nr:predicted protein [Scheffersomyces stipitis CBS 6054]ABN65460.2 predicted protein [Scheffersomyces stipitis CBS 6054]KAG2733494.1 hypothetical protein G9P44_003019 [Scheffersomyces stipitis]
MFKSSISSYFVPSWFRKPAASSKDTARATTGPKSFTIPSPENSNQLVNISMKDTAETGDADSFVDIEYRHLTYAEAASLAKDKKQAPLKSNPPRKSRLPINQYNVLTEEDLEAANDAYEPFKEDTKRKTRQNLKNRDFELKKKRKALKHKKLADLN